MLRTVAWIPLALAVAASAASCHTKPQGPIAPLTGFDERQACTKDEDCVVIEVECCDHCNGGTAIGVHRDHAAEVDRDYPAPGTCEGVACTLMACAVAEPVCENQRCAVDTGGPEPQLTPLPPP